MRDIFHDAVSGSEKKRNCPKADKERKFSTENADETFSGFCLTIRFRPSRHGREHIEFALVMQSANGDLNALCGFWPRAATTACDLVIRKLGRRGDTSPSDWRTRGSCSSLPTLSFGQVAEIPRGKPCRL